MCNAGLDLDELEALLNDDTDGQRFANFLQKKQGKTRQHRRVFRDIDAPRLSLKVRVQKVNKPNNDGIQINEQQNSPLKQNRNSTKAKDDQNGNSMSPPKSTTNTNISNSVSKTPIQILNTQAFRLSAHKSGGGLSDRLRRYSLKRASGLTPGRRALIQEFENTFDSTHFVPPICSTPNTEPNMLNGNDIDDNMLENKNYKDSITNCNRDTQSELRSLQHKDAELLEILEATLKRGHQEKNSELSKTVRTPSPKIPSSPLGSSRRRTYTVEKGDRPGQIVLTPESEFPMTQNLAHNLSTCEARQTPSIRVKKDEILFGTTKVLKLLNRLKTPTKESNKKENNEKTQDINLVPASPIPSSYSEPQLHNSIVPETQKIAEERQQLIQSLQKPNATMVVIPLYQTFNGSTVHSDVQNNVKTALQESSKLSNAFVKTNKEIHNTESKNDSGKANLPADDDETPKAPPSPVQENAVDNLRLSDIITDDDEVLNQTRNISAPLNLAAPSQTNQRTRRLRKRSTIRRRLEMENCVLPSTEPESDFPDRRSPLNLRSKMNSKDQNSTRTLRMVNLNKPPSHPINGEEFAIELERMSYNEILDLRKRNSMGKVFCIDGRRSSAKLDVIKKKKNLEEEIESELRRRKSISDIGENMCANNHLSLFGVANASEKSQLPPAPKGFEDSSNQRVPGEAFIRNAEVGKDVTNISLSNEYEHDRVSFLSVQQKRKRARELPETLKNYLEASKKLKKKPKRLHQSKRSLYSKGNSDVEENSSDSSFEKIDNISMPPTVPSPPHRSIHHDLSEIPIVPPPPPLNLMETVTVSQLNVEGLISGPFRQPSIFDIDSSRAIVNNEEAQILRSQQVNETDLNNTEKRRKSKIINCTVSASMETETNQLISITTVPEASLSLSQPPNIITKNDDALFKKPIGRPRKKREPYKSLKNTSDNKMEQIVSKTITIPANQASSETFHETSESPTNNSVVRRSKRTIKENSALSQLQKYYETEMQRHENRKKRVETIKKQESMRTISKTRFPLASSTPFSHSDNLISNDTKKTNTRGKKRVPAMQSALTDRVYSMLGDTNCTAMTTAINRRPMSPIYEAYTENIDINNEQEHVGDNLNQKEKTQEVLKYKRNNNAAKKKIVTNKRKAFQETVSSTNQLTPAPIDKLNTIFDQLKSASICIEQDGMEEIASSSSVGFSSCLENNSSKANQNHRKLRIRLKRLNATQSKYCKKPNEGDKNTEATNIKQTTENFCIKSKTSNRDAENGKISSLENSVTKSGELLTWLKCVVGNSSMSARNKQLFTEMHISTAGNLIFTEIEGIDFAFYDTEHKTSLGYLRFKPRQIKPSKRAKQYNLHFIVLAGEFKFGTNNEEGTFRDGDMVAINKGVRYSIENATDDIGILMVIKK